MNKLTIAAACMTLGLALLATQMVGETPNGDIIVRKIKSEVASSAVTSHPASGGGDLGPPRSTVSRAWGKGREAAGKGSFMDKAALREEVDQLRKTWNAAWLENDSATVDKLMAPEYVYIGPNGQVSDRSKIMGVILSPSYKLHHAGWTEVQINLLSDSTAVIIDHLQGSGTLNGNSFSDNNRCSRVCLRRNGAWQIVFEQASAILP
jgi:hypothetical protein